MYDAVFWGVVLLMDGVVDAYSLTLFRELNLNSEPSASKGEENESMAYIGKPVTSSLLVYVTRPSR